MFGFADEAVFLLKLNGTTYTLRKGHALILGGNRGCGKTVIGAIVVRSFSLPRST